MTQNPTVADPNMLAVEGLNLMQEKSINGLMLCQDGALVGGAKYARPTESRSNVMTQTVSTLYGSVDADVFQIAKEIKLLICDVDGCVF